LTLILDNGKHEKNIPTQQNQKSSHTWLSRKDGDSRRAQSAKCTQSKRAGEAYCCVTKASYRFQPHLRLKKAADFKKVFANPIKSADRYFTLLATPIDCTNPRLGLAISKKIIRKAVHRNAVKRIVRESFRLQQHIMSPIDVVVLARKEVMTATLVELNKSLTRHWLNLASKCAPSS
jgi:ribonuclease P protein component